MTSKNSNRFTGLFLASTLFLCGTVLVTDLGGCTPGQRQIAKTVFDVAKVACIIANAELNDPALQVACDIANSDILGARKIADEQVMASKRYAASKAGACAPESDGGRK